MDYDQFLSDYGKRIAPAVLREMARVVYTESQDTIYLGGGFPNPEVFPIESMLLNLKDGSSIELDSACTYNALQYTIASGIPDVLEEVKKLIQRYHDPPLYDKLCFCMCNGAQDGLAKAFQVLINPGDYVVVPNPIYSGILDCLRPLNAKVIGVPEHDHGLVLEELKRTLEMLKSHNKVMKAIYVNPSSTNPAGVTYSEDQCAAIYKLAQEYNLLIIEDDPYHFLYFTEHRPKSFLSIDTDGRVIRMDSFSKILAPGLRLGVISGPKKIVLKMEYGIQISTQQASSLSQIILFSLLQKWGENGLHHHLCKLRAFYKQQATYMVQCAQKWLTGLAEWHAPKGGMFLWLKLNDIKDTKKFILYSLAPKGVFLAPGQCFVPDHQPSQYVRVAFSYVSEEQMDEAMRLLAEAIKEQTQILNNN